MCVLCGAAHCALGSIPLEASGTTVISGEGLVGASSQDISGALNALITPGLLWPSSNITYGFPDSADAYASAPPVNGETEDFMSLSSVGKDMIRDAFSVWDGIAAINLSESNTPDIAVSGSGAPTTAWAYLPDNLSNPNSGDIWIGLQYSFNALFTAAEPTPYVGSYEYYVILHEIGHALGLKHPHAGIFGLQNGTSSSNWNTMSLDFDSVEYTVMSYRSFLGSSTTSLTISGGHYPQSLMMLDIAAIQELYGADFSTLSGNTVYSFSPGSGQMFVNGVSTGATEANTVFRTLWDGGGTDLIDLSAYSTDSSVDLNPGGGIVFDKSGLTQRAELLTANGLDPVYAGANVYMSLLYQGDTRSLIENVTTGSGDDLIIGNAANNVIAPGSGRNTVAGGAGYDTVRLDVTKAALAYFTIAGDLVLGYETSSVALTGIERVQTLNGTVALDALAVTPTTNGLFIGDRPYEILSGQAGGKDTGLFTISGDASSLTVSDSAWKVAFLPIVISATTVLSFDFSASTLGKIHGIGFASSDSLSATSFFQLAGTQQWGLQAHDDYSIGSGVKSYEIAVGQYLAGQSFDRIVFVADDGVAITADSTFANIDLSDGPLTEVMIGTDLYTIVDDRVTGNDFGTYTLSADARSLTVSQNGWKVAFLPITITADTILSFDFSSTALGEIHGIGFASSDALASASFFQLTGSQDWGMQAFNDYSVGSGVKSYDIAVGQYLAGQSFDRIVFVADDDANGMGNSTFANINLGEDLPASELSIDGSSYEIVDSRVTGNDFGSYTLSNDGSSLTVAENGWKVAFLPITITANTVLSFDFSSTALGEIHGIGFASSDALASASFFQLAGTQEWGLQAYDDYSGGSGVKSYDIAVGQYLAGQSFDRIVFVADDDANAAGNSTFANINLSESAPATELSIDGSSYAVVDNRVQNNDFGSYTLSNDGSSLTVAENGWKVAFLPITITADTVLSFDFSATTLGEVHGIGLASSDKVNETSFFQLAGTQEWGQQAYADYSVGSGVKSYDIAVGQYLAGQSFDRIVFVADDDANAAGNSTFANIDFV